ncbi:MAG TPA: hypothetical protein VKI18_08835, partial [Albitalea sp.]|nr:hypothetical protein [Albitalea sp.]
MTPADVDRVFGRGRVKMVTGEHVEVYREAALPGERRRYTKRFLATDQGDFRHWTEREWRILARLVGHRIGPVPDVVQFDRGDASRPALVQTYDAGITVDHWATLLPVERHGQVLRHVFEDCAHWWALAQHCLAALDAIHELQLVHLDLKADNVCIPLGPADFDPRVPGALLYPLFTQVTLIDFAFSLVSGENLATALPIAHQGEYDYQSPRLLRALEAGRRGELQPTRQLDWRCDVFSLAAMLRRYLPQRGLTEHGGWTESRLAQAQGLVSRLFDAHHGPLPARRPHRQWIGFAERMLNDPALAASLAKGWQLTNQIVAPQLDGPTPVTRIAVPVAPLPLPVAAVANEAPARAARRAERIRRLVWASGALALAALAVPLIGETWLARRDAGAPVAAVDPAAGSASAPEVVVAQAPAAAEVATAAASVASESAAAVETAAASVDAKQEAERRAEVPPAPAPAVAAAPKPAAAPTVAAAARTTASTPPTPPTPRIAATASARKTARSASIAKAALKPAPTSRFAAKRFVLPAIPPPPTPDPAPAAVVVSQATLPISAPAPAPAPAPPAPSPAPAPAAPAVAMATPSTVSAPVLPPRAADDALVPASLPG